MFIIPFNSFMSGFQNIIAKHKGTLLLFLLFLPVLKGISQTTEKDSTLLRHKAHQVQTLLTTDVEKASVVIDELLEEAIAQKDKKIELQLLANKCRYYFHKQDIDGLILASDNLFKKAVEYKNRRSQATAKMYLAEVFKSNELYKDAIKELEEALKILEDEDSTDLDIISTKSNIYIIFSNYYSFLKQPKDAVRMIKLNGKEIKKFPEGDRRNYLDYAYHSSLGIIYTQYDIDSAEYHAKQAIKIKPEHIGADDNIMLYNYYSLGAVYKNKDDFEQAIRYLTLFEARALEIGDSSNLEEAYSMLIDIAKKTDDSVIKEEYEAKLQTLRLEKTKSKNKSLHKIIEIEKIKQQEISKKKNKSLIFWISITLLFSLLTIFISVFLYRKRLHNKYEKLSQEYLEKNNNVEDINLDIYNEIIELVKQEDTSFMTSFNKVFPDFTNKLLEINPTLVRGEVEFCALLKLNLTTKQIAQFKTLQPRTVQNKKYQIRKKLNIPNNTDIYNWVHNV